MTLTLERIKALLHDIEPDATVITMADLRHGHQVRGDEWLVDQLGDEWVISYHPQTVSALGRAVSVEAARYVQALLAEGGYATEITNDGNGHPTKVLVTAPEPAAC